MSKIKTFVLDTNVLLHSAKALDAFEDNLVVIPMAVIILVSRSVCKLNFCQILGLASGGTTDPAVLAFSQEIYGTDYPSIHYATVYPLTMFLRVLVAQLLILFAL